MVCHVILCNNIIWTHIVKWILCYHILSAVVFFSILHERTLSSLSIKFQQAICNINTSWFNIEAKNVKVIRGKHSLWDMNQTIGQKTKNVNLFSFLPLVFVDLIFVKPFKFPQQNKHFYSVSIFQADRIFYKSRTSIILNIKF